MNGDELTRALDLLRDETEALKRDVHKFLDLETDDRQGVEQDDDRSDE
jgi:hypothetical protein